MGKVLSLTLSDKEHEKLKALASYRKRTPEQCIYDFIDAAVLDGGAWKHPAKVRPSGSRDQSLLRGDLDSLLGSEGADALKTKNALVEMGHRFESVETLIHELITSDKMELYGWILRKKAVKEEG
jgi:hypothetical protein